MKDPTRLTLDIIALAIRIGTGQDKDGRLQKRLNTKLANPPLGGFVAVAQRPYARNPNPWLP